VPGPARRPPRPRGRCSRSGRAPRPCPPRTPRAGGAGCARSPGTTSRCRPGTTSVRSRGAASMARMAASTTPRPRRAVPARLGGEDRARARGRIARRLHGHLDRGCWPARGPRAQRRLGHGLDAGRALGARRRPAPRRSGRAGAAPGGRRMGPAARQKPPAPRSRRGSPQGPTATCSELNMTQPLDSPIDSFQSDRHLAAAPHLMRKAQPGSSPGLTPSAPSRRAWRRREGPPVGGESPAARGHHAVARHRPARSRPRIRGSRPRPSAPPRGRVAAIGPRRRGRDLHEPEPLPAAAHGRGFQVLSNRASADRSPAQKAARSSRLGLHVVGGTRCRCRPGTWDRSAAPSSRARRASPRSMSRCGALWVPGHHGEGPRGPPASGPARRRRRARGGTESRRRALRGLGRRWRSWCLAWTQDKRAVSRRP
jgi:hypothetical protein